MMATKHAPNPKDHIGKTIATLLAVIVLIVVAVLISELGASLVTKAANEHAGDITRAALATAAIWLGLEALLVRFRKYGRTELGLSFLALRKGLGRGLVFGVGSAILAFVIALGMGAFELRWGQGVTVAQVLTLVVATLVHAYFEELAFRSGLVGTALRRFPGALAISIPALLFACGHLANDGVSLVGVANTAIAGLVLGFMFLAPQDGESPRMGLATGWHAGWNLAVALCGTPVSGMERSTWLISDPVGSTFWSGGEYGIEGSFAATLVVGSILLLLLSRRRRSRVPQKPEVGAEDGRS